MLLYVMVPAAQLRFSLKSGDPVMTGSRPDTSYTMIEDFILKTLLRNLSAGVISRLKESEVHFSGAKRRRQAAGQVTRTYRRTGHSGGNATGSGSACNFGSPGQPQKI
jgi:hypothetical protein